MKIGIIVPNLGPSYKNIKLMENINKVHASRKDVDIIVFFENHVRPCLLPNFATMPLIDAFNYDGHLIATTLPIAYKILKFTGSRKKYFFVWDLEWLSLPNKNYEALSSVYSNPNLKLFARNEHHKNIIEKMWDKKVVGLYNDFEVEKIIPCLKELENTTK
jgi:hypothetical protein